jgi:hypothetical protein
VFGAMHARLTQGSPGSFAGLLPGSLPDDADCLVAEQLLQLLGLPREEAAEIARRPLPESSEELLRAADAKADEEPFISRRTTP